MIARVFRVLIGLVVACLAAGLTMVAFVYSPSELMDGGGDKLAEAGLLALAAATHSAIFAAPFALIAAVIGEWQALRGWLYYAPAGTAIAGAGFLAQYWTEAGEDASIANSYAVMAFLASGCVAGTVFWLLSGRLAGGRGQVDSQKRPSAPQAVSEGLKRATP
jgi:hypothetical protein